MRRAVLDKETFDFNDPFQQVMLRLTQRFSLNLNGLFFPAQLFDFGTLLIQRSFGISELGPGVFYLAFDRFFSCVQVLSFRPQSLPGFSELGESRFLGSRKLKRLCLGPSIELSLRC